MEGEEDIEIVGLVESMGTGGVAAGGKLGKEVKMMMRALRADPWMVLESKRGARWISI